MRRQYFKDSDTLSFSFGSFYVDGPIDHVDLECQTALELDCEGNLVELTIEHAKERGLPDSSWWAPPARGETKRGEGAGDGREDRSEGRTYFEDTDTLYLKLSDERIAETLPLDENTLLELDADGNAVALTIEFARARNLFPNLSVEHAPA